MDQYHKNIKNISQSMEQWIQSNIASIGVYECCYGYYNLKTKQWMSMPTVYSWYCAYMEKGFTVQVKDRFHEGLIPWRNSDLLYREYKKHLQKKDLSIGSKFDLVRKTNNGFEMLTFGTLQPVRFEDYQTLYHGLHDLSYQAHQIVQRNPDIMRPLEIEAPQIITHKHSHTSWDTLKKFKFGSLILTGQELQLIQQLLSLMTYEEIALSQSVTLHEVERSFYRLKEKIKNPHITNSELFIELRKNYVLMSHLKDFV